MANEPIVRAQLVLRALNEVQKDEGTVTLQRLERQEPDLVEFVMERLTDIQHQLWASGLTDHESRRVYPRVQELVLTAVESMRLGQAELLEGLSPDSNAEGGQNQSAGEPDDTSNEDDHDDSSNA